MADKLWSETPFYQGAPYPAFRFHVIIPDVVNGSAPEIAAGFSDVSGLGAETNFSEYRPGNAPQLMTMKIPNTAKFDDVVLKRGLIGSMNLFKWIEDYFTKGEIAPRTISIQILTPKREPGVQLDLLSALPKKWVGPTLAGKGGGEVAMEELHLVHHGIQWK